MRRAFSQKQWWLVLTPKSVRREFRHLTTYPHECGNSTHTLHYIQLHLQASIKPFSSISECRITNLVVDTIQAIDLW